MTITEFLEARISDDESHAWSEMGAEYFTDGAWPEECAARVLAECAAKRAIIAAATSWEHEFNPSAWYACRAYKLKEGTWKVLKISEGKCNCGVTRQRSAILKPLAAVYASHPDYQPEWGV